MTSSMRFSLILALLATYASADSQPAGVPAYPALKTGSPIVVDGRLDEPAWHSAEVIDRFVNTVDGSAGRYKTEARIVYDDRFVYFGFRSFDDNVWATKKQRDDHLWEEEVVEVFIKPVDSIPGYVELEVNPLGAMLDTYLVDSSKGPAFDAWNLPDLHWAVQVQGTVDGLPGDTGWTCEIAFPIQGLPAPFPNRLAREWRVNLYRGESLPASALLAWSPTYKEDFHIPSRFGRLVFTGKETSRLSPAQTPDDWIHRARITGNGLGPNGVDRIMKRALEEGTLGIELDNDITGRYDSFLDPTEKLGQIRQAAEAAHRIGNHAFIYIAGLECITARADRNRSMFKDHPDWVQRDKAGNPALFTGGASFWVDAGDEDVWISPYAAEWRSLYMERVRQIAATGIDGIYVDVAYWMWLYAGWENSWASFDDATAEAFRRKTGLDARQAFTPGDFNNPAFLAWVDFRIQTITDFIREIDDNVKSVNPRCLTIPEVSPTVNDEVIRSGADVYALRECSDVITHEFFINTNTGAKRNTFDWITYLLGIHTLRAFDGDHATWLLSYSWDREPGTDSIDAMKLLSCAQVLSGANTWDAPRYWMAGSNDYPTRRRLFGWIRANEELLYSPRTPVRPIGVYFSPASRNAFGNEVVKSFYGTLHLLLQTHREYVVVTPRTIDEFDGAALILPDARILPEEEAKAIQRQSDRGLPLIVTGETGYYDRFRQTTKANSLLAYLSKKEGPARKYLHLPECPGKAYFEGRDTILIARYDRLLGDFLQGDRPKYRIRCSRDVNTEVTTVNGKECIFIVNLRGLKGYSSCQPSVEEGIEIEFDAGAAREAWILPFLGEKKSLSAGLVTSTDDQGKRVTKLRIPPVDFGAVVEFGK
jgi:hypothetical protein